MPVYLRYMEGKHSTPWTTFQEALGSTTNGVLFALAVAIRILPWPFLPYHHDEFSALGRLNVAEGEGFVAWLKEAVFEDYHPAGAQIFLKAWAKLGELLGVPLEGPSSGGSRRPSCLPRLPDWWPLSFWAVGGLEAPLLA